MTDYYARFINLPHRTDRLAHMQGQLSRITSFKAEMTRGMYPQEYKGTQNVEKMRRRTPGAIGCHMSQVRVMKEALAAGQHAIVMEDDLHFCDDFDKRFEYATNYLGSILSWDVFWFGSSFHVNPPYWHRVGGSGMPPDCSANLGYDAKLTDDARIIQTFGAFSTMAYMVNVASIEKITKLLDKHLHESIGIDWLFVKLQPQLKCFAFLPGMVKQIDNRSDIGTGDTIWSGFLKLNGTYENSAYVFQPMMNDFNPETFNWAECKQ